MINHLDQAAPVLRGGNIAVLFADRRRRRRHRVDHADVDGILGVVLATLTDLELHLVSTQDINQSRSVPASIICLQCFDTAGWAAGRASDS